MSRFYCNVILLFFQFLIHLTIFFNFDCNTSGYFPALNPLTAKFNNHKFNVAIYYALFVTQRCLFKRGASITFCVQPSSNNNNYSQTLEKELEKEDKISTFSIIIITRNEVLHALISCCVSIKRPSRLYLRGRLLT